MKRYHPQNQLSIEDFGWPLETKLDPNNRWVVLAGIVPWDVFAKEYYKNFKTNRGAPTLDARLVLGVVIIKHLMKLDDVSVIEVIQESPYLQYFVGLTAFTTKPVMDSSLLVHIRKRINLDAFESMTEELMRQGLKMKETNSLKSRRLQRPGKKEQAENHDDDSMDLPNQGKLQMDATVADAEIKFPTDLDMLNDSREKAESLIDALSSKLELKKKPRDYRRNARKDFLSLSKKKRKSEKDLRKGISKQLGYVRRDIKIINHLLDQLTNKGINHVFDQHQLKYFYVIQQVFAQQHQMHRTREHSVEDRIVSIHQPHVRPIVRGKAKAKVEFGAKINVSLVNGFARIDHFDWNAYNEGVDLKMQVERYKDLHGFYPELVQVDKIYLNRESRAWLKERNIRHTGDPLGRKQKKETTTYYQKQKKRQECAERNQIEGKFGQGKRGYGLNNIKARTASTSMSWIGAIIFVMNLIRYLKVSSAQYLALLVSQFVAKILRMKQIILTKTPNPACNFAGFGIIQ